MNFQLMLGDCLDRMREIPTGSVDMVLCDLPYGVTACKWDSVIPFAPLWAEYERVWRGESAIVLTATQPFASALVMSNADWFRYSWYWQKNRPTGFPNANFQPLRDIEEICVFTKYAPNPAAVKKPFYTPQGVTPMSVVKTRKRSMRNNDIANGDKDGSLAGQWVQQFSNYPRQLLQFSTDSNTVHPTQKPVALMEYLINTYTNPGETVLDNTMGSGTTGVACGNTGRKFIGIERDPGYFEIARRRIAGAHLPPLPGPPNK